MIKPTSITALQTFFFIANIDSLVASIEQAREALQATWVEWPRLDALLLVAFVRILAISDNEQQEWKLNTEPTTAPGEMPPRSS
jgi:hypothetical protein